MHPRQSTLLTLLLLLAGLLPATSPAADSDSAARGE